MNQNDFASKLDGLSVQDGSEYLSILYGFLSLTSNIVCALSNADWEHGSFFECLNQSPFVLVFLDVFNWNCQLFSSDFTESKDDIFAIGSKINFGDSVAHQVQNCSAVVQTEESLT